MRIIGATGATGPTGPAGIGVTGPQSPAGVTGPGIVAARVPPEAVTPIVTASAGAQKKPIPIKPNFANFPAELKSLPNWVLWRYLPPKSNGGKWRKVPFQPNRKTASTVDRSTWSRFEQACAAYAHGGFDGLGFVFDGDIGADGLCYCGVDFDACVRDGTNVDSLARNRIKRLNTYTEASVSGTGFHCIVRAEPLDRIVKHDGVEIYTNARFFTFTGRAFGKIKTAPTQVRALVDEIRAKEAAAKQQQQSGRSGSDGLSSTELTNPFNNAKPAQAFAALDLRDSLADGIKTTPWFETLLPEQKDEVVDHALGMIAKNTQLLELESDGGNNAEYYKLTVSVARSGAPNAEEIFVKHASSAKSADSNEKLRQHFSRCSESQPSGNREITVGTLLHTARECGANFDQWKQIADGGDPDVAMFIPGNEEDCRIRLDLVVAADPCTYTLGDPTGPLVILRVPKREALPSETRWEGDLPGTTLAAPADVMERAERIVWMRKGKQGPYRSRPPRDFITDYLTQMRGRYGARPLRSIVRVPRIDDSGNIHFNSGYDAQTGLFHDKSPTFEVSPNPSLDAARSAAKLLLHPFSKYQFDDPAAGQALLLAAIFTAIERPFLPVAPMFVVRSSMPGTGKGLIVRGLVWLAFDTAPVFITWGGNGEEFEKRLAALLLQSPGMLCIDNANGIQIKGDLIESIITEGCADIRPLGHSKIVKVRSRPFVTLAGNNPIITGDMARRALPIDILPRSADPERDRYDFNPVELIQRRRADFLQAAFIAMRAFRLAGMPSQGLPAVGSFDDWSRRVRDLVYWLTGYDISEVFRRNKAEDPRRQGDASLLAALHQHFGTEPFTSAEAIAVHKKVADHRRSSLTLPTPTQTEQALHEAIEAVLGSRDVNAKLFGHCARRVKGAHNGGFILETQTDPTTNANIITVRRT
jgi:hypothetical protein